MYMQLESMQEPNSTAPGDGDSANVKIRAPKRVLHFSDGVIEEYSDDDEIDATPTEQSDNTTIVDPKTLTWGPWLSYKAWSAGSTALSVCDYIGEGLASFLGITTPKYWYEIEEYKRLQAEKEKERKEAEGWSEPVSSGDVNLEPVKTNQPEPKTSL